MKFYTTRDVARLLGRSEPQVGRHARDYLAPDRGPATPTGSPSKISSCSAPPKPSAGRGSSAPGPARAPGAAPASSPSAARSAPCASVGGRPRGGAGRRGGLAARVRPARARFRRSPAGGAPDPSPAGWRQQARRSARPLTAEQWYDLGWISRGGPGREPGTRTSRAIALDPRHAAARVIWAAAPGDGHPAEAVAQYRAALGAQPRTDRRVQPGHGARGSGPPGRGDRSLSSRGGADADFADAHFNLARLYEQAGKRTAALRHLQAYQQLSQ